MERLYMSLNVQSCIQMSNGLVEESSHLSHLSHLSAFGSLGLWLCTRSPGSPALCNLPCSATRPTELVPQNTPVGNMSQKTRRWSLESHLITWKSVVYKFVNVKKHQKNNKKTLILQQDQRKISSCCKAGSKMMRLRSTYLKVRHGTHYHTIQKSSTQRKRIRSNVVQECFHFLG